ncbi:segregation/condensation protein A [Candidatus Woesearchaeota archaeon]|nr:segregation/condensation protein A [Candidatus Woesearchaeota archaeon]
MQNKLYEMLINEDEITWQSIIYDLIKTEQMDPWDINISLLAKRYLETIKELQDHSFFISGKVVLAASLLLRIKSYKLVNENIAEFDNLLFQKEQDLLSEEENPLDFLGEEKIPTLLVKTPQARKRKVTVNDLIEALQKALQVDEKRNIRRRDERVLREINLPKYKIDISALIKNLYLKIKDFFQNHPKVTFTQLLPSDKKEDKIYTFIPLLHLASQNKVNLEQEAPFGEINITEAKEED